MGCSRRMRKNYRGPGDEGEGCVGEMSADDHGPNGVLVSRRSCVSNAEGGLSTVRSDGVYLGLGFERERCACGGGWDGSRSGLNVGVCCSGPMGGWWESRVVYLPN